MGRKSKKYQLNSRLFLLLAFICCIASVVFAGISRIAIALISTHVLPLLQLDPNLLDITFNDLLVFFGVAAGICYSIWAYRSSQLERVKENNEQLMERQRIADQEWKEYRPEFDISIVPDEGYFELTIDNCGIKTYSNIRYCDCGRIASRLRSGETVKLLICKSLCEDNTLTDTASSTRAIVDFDWYGEQQYPFGFFISAYDSRDCLWMVNCEIVDGTISKYSVTNG